MSLLEIKNLHATIDDNEILKGINLTVNPGEVHSIMGPNGSGKSTLAAGAGAPRSLQRHRRPSHSSMAKTCSR